METEPWILYYHGTTEKNWSKKSYKKVWEFNTVEDYWRFFNNFEYLHDGMLFFMRKDVFPLWEEPKNINGGSWSIKVSNKEAKDLWLEITMGMIGGYLTPLHMDDITGLSITPKPRASLIKIWHGHSKLKDEISFERKGDFMYKKFKKR